MLGWSRIPERVRLHIAIGAAAALLVGGLLLAVLNERLYKEQKIREVTVQSEILAASVTAALVFHDPATASEYVRALEANPEVQAAAVYDESGQLLAGHARAGAAPLPPQAPTTPVAFEDAVLVVSTPVIQNGTQIGRVYLRTVTEPLPRRLTRYAGVALLVLMASMLVAVLGAAQAAQTRANAKLEDRARALAEANRKLRVQISEREKAEEALRQSQKMEAIGQLTGGVAHDFNNLLMVASAGLDLMERTTDLERRRKLKDSIRQAVERGAALTRQLLAFSRRTALKPEVIDLGTQVEGMRLLLDRSLRENITVEMALPPGLWPVELDAAELELALLNLAVNARDAMPSGGAITIHGDNVQGLELGELKGDFVRLSVTDTGIGMAPEMVTRVFEPFFTTKEVGKGTGLGLSQVYGFTRASGGDVVIESELGRGTTVSLYLPRSTKALAERPEGDARKEPERGHGRVLLVEDDDGVAELVTGMLAELGYQVTRTASAAEALEALAKRTRYEVVFSDLVMPGGMDGIELAREIRRTRPELPIVLTTGYSSAAAAVRREGLRLLFKPYRMDSLADALESARKEQAAEAS